MASVFTMVWPALSARSPAAWIAGPSAIGSENGMPISMMSAPAAGSAFRIASEVVVVRVAGRDEGDERRARGLPQLPRNGGRCGWSWRSRYHKTAGGKRRPVEPASPAWSTRPGVAASTPSPLQRRPTQMRQVDSSLAPKARRSGQAARGTGSS